MGVKPKTAGSGSAVGWADFTGTAASWWKLQRRTISGTQQAWSSAILCERCGVVVLRRGIWALRMPRSRIAAAKACRSRVCRLELVHGCIDPFASRRASIRSIEQQLTPIARSSPSSRARMNPGQLVIPG